MFSGLTTSVLEYAKVKAEQLNIEFRIRLEREIEQLVENNELLKAEIEIDKINTSDGIKLYEKAQHYIEKLNDIKFSSDTLTGRVKCRYISTKAKLRLTLLKLKYRFGKLPQLLENFVNENVKVITDKIESLHTALNVWFQSILTSATTVVTDIEAFILERRDVYLIDNIDIVREKHEPLANNISSMANNVIDRFYHNNIDMTGTPAELLNFICDGADMDFTNTDTSEEYPEFQNVDYRGEPRSGDETSEDNSEPNESGESSSTDTEEVNETRTMIPYKYKTLAEELRASAGIFKSDGPVPFGCESSSESSEGSFELNPKTLAPRLDNDSNAKFTYVHSDYQKNFDTFLHSVDLLDNYDLFDSIPYSFTPLVTTVKHGGSIDVPHPLLDMRGDCNSAGKVTRMMTNITRHRSKTIHVKRKNKFIFYINLAAEGFKYVIGLPVDVSNLFNFRVSKGKHTSSDTLLGQCMAPSTMNLHSRAEIARTNVDLRIRTNNSVNIPYNYAYKPKYGPLYEGTAMHAIARREHMMWTNVANGCHFRL